MKHWEEAALLTEVLDRHASHLIQGFAGDDWTLFHHVERFLSFLGSEPVLSAFADEYRAEAAAALNPIAEGMKWVLEKAELALGRFGEHIVRDKVQLVADTMNFIEVADALRYAKEVFIDPEKGDQALSKLIECVRKNSGALGDQGALLRECEGWQGKHRALASRFARYSTNQPGAAYQRLQEAVAHSDYAVQGAAAEVEAWNQRAAQLQVYIREASLWRGLEGRLSQPGVLNIQESVRVLHLALVTSLARGRSRWAMVKRFAARCESLDRVRLQSGLRDANGKPEAFLTLEFARYLFDAGYNPLVDADACGLRPDVLDVAAEPAIYVEAKQYKNVSDAVASELERGLAQTLNTWSRLANRWRVPEAFLLVFRRSGRPIEFKNPELRVNGGRLYVLCVDIADAAESGSRAESPVGIDLQALLDKSAGKDRT